MKLVMLFLLCLLASSIQARAESSAGEDVYQRCIACHSFERNRSGPKHCGVVGRPAGSLPGYAFSKAMKKSGIVWDEETLDRFLENPLKTVPGTRMAYAGVKDRDDRRALIAYLRTMSNDPAICR